MRKLPDTFAGFIGANVRSMRHVVVIDFGIGGTVAITSHDDVTWTADIVLDGLLEKVSSVSQKIDPESGRATIGTLSFKVVDVNAAFTTVLDSKLTAGYSVRRKKVRHYVSAGSLVQTDFLLQTTQQVNDISNSTTGYDVSCSDVQRELREQIFALKSTTLSSTITATDTVIPAANTDAFEMVQHGPSYTDAPNALVGYFKLDDEIIRYTGKTANSFTGCVRGALGTRAEVHEVGDESPDRRPTVEEYVYLELPALKLAFTVLTGILYTPVGTRALPEHWHLGLSHANDLDFIGWLSFDSDLWNLVDDTQGLILRFEGIGATSGKKWLEDEVYRLCGIFTPVMSDGRLSVRRLSNISPGASFVYTLNTDNVSRVGKLQHNISLLQNQYRIEWNWNGESFTRAYQLTDADSIGIHGTSKIRVLKFKGMHGSRHTQAIVKSVVDNLRDRFAAPPETLDLDLLPSAAPLEVGDVVMVDLPNVRDYAGGRVSIQRAMEIQQISHDYIAGKIKARLFGSTRTATISGATLPPVVLLDTFYTSAGTAMSSLATITTNVLQSSVALTGHETDIGNAAAIFYHAADLTIPVGVTLTLRRNVQLRIRGTLTVNGEIRCEEGHAGTIAGTPGLVGSTASGNGIMIAGNGATTIQGTVVRSLYDSLPSFVLENKDGTAISGLPSDLRGTGGSQGAVAVGGIPGANVSPSPGVGGAGGGGLMVISRGMAFGLNGGLITTGANGSLAPSPPNPGGGFAAGSGAGGGPGAALILLDGGAAVIPTMEGKFEAFNGTVPSTLNVTWPPSSAEYDARGWPLDTWSVDNYFGYALGKIWSDNQQGFGGFPDAPFFLSGADYSRSAFRVQFVPPAEVAEEDAPPPVQDFEFNTIHNGDGPPLDSLGINGDYYVDTLNDTWWGPKSSNTWTGTGPTTLVGQSIEVEYSVNGTTGWHFPFTVGDLYMRQRVGTGDWTDAIRIVGEAGGGGPYTDFKFQRAPTPPSTPVVANPVGWFDAPPLGTDPLYVISATKNADGDLTSAWSDPIRLDGPEGPEGPTGNAINYIFRRAISPPATPTGNNIPTDWFDNPPAGADPLYMSKAEQTTTGVTVGLWSAPVRLDGAIGDPGAKWYSGAGAPAGATGLIGDWYLNETNGDVYEKTGTTTWALRGNLKGDDGTDGSPGSAALNVGSKMDRLDQWFIYATGLPVTTWTVETVNGPTGALGMQHVSNTTGSDSIKSEKFTIDPTKKHRVSLWVRQPSGDRNSIPFVQFYDAAGAIIGSATSDAVGWPGGVGAVSHNITAVIAFPTTWTLYAVEFGGDATATIPDGAVAMALGGSFVYNGSTPTTIQMQDYRVVELAADGAHGQRVGILEMYRWSAAAPATFPSGASIYMWADGTFTAPSTTNSWLLTPGAPVAGQTLWGISVIVSDNLTTATSTATWNSSSPYAVGYAGANGANGVNGSRTAVLDVYRWSSTVPVTFPSGTSTYTWATGQFTAPATLNDWALAPPAPVEGQTLYIARRIYADTNTTLTTEITWNVNNAIPFGAAGTDGTNGANGQRVGILEVYRWAAVAPTGFPSGTSTYTWANGTFTAPSTPNSWSLVPGAPVAGQTLWGIAVSVSDNLTTATSTATWNSSSPYVVGYAGSNGEDGTNGVNGTRTAILDVYRWSVAAPTTFPSGNSTYTWATGQFTAPATLNSWSLTPPAPVLGQTLWALRQVYADTDTTATSVIAWSANAPMSLAAAGINGTNGTHGQRVGILEVYRWSAAAPTTYPSGTSTYTWATGAFTAPATLNSWSLTPGAAIQGQTLWGISVVVSNNLTTPTSSISWNSTTVYPVGYAGDDGADGTDGSPGSPALNVGRKMDRLDQWFDYTTGLPLDDWTVETVNGPIGTLGLQHIGSGANSIKSERVTFNPSKRHRVSWWAKQPAGTGTNIPFVQFYDAANNIIGSATSDAVGWPTIGTVSHNLVNPGIAFPTTWTLYTFEFGGDATATIPTGAVTLALCGSYAISSQTTLQLQDYHIVELADRGEDGYPLNLTPSRDFTYPIASTMGGWDTMYGVVGNAEMRNDIVGPHGGYPLIARTFSVATTTTWVYGLRHYFPVNPNRAYITFAWVARKTAASQSVYCGWTTTANHIMDLAGAANVNTYFVSGAAGVMTVGKWYLAVGVISPMGTTISTNLSGLYDPATGTRVMSGIDVRHHNNAPTTQFIRLGYHTTSAGQTSAEGISILPAGTFLLDGAQPTIEQMLRRVAGQGTLATATEITMADLAAGLQPIEIVTSLPATGNYAGRVVFLTTDQKLHRHTGSPTGATGFSKAVDGTDLLLDSVTAGKIDVSTLQALAINTGFLQTRPAGASTTPRLVIQDSNTPLQIQDQSAAGLPILQVSVDGTTALVSLKGALTNVDSNFMLTPAVEHLRNRLGIELSGTESGGEKYRSGTPQALTLATNIAVNAGTNPFVVATTSPLTFSIRIRDSDYEVGAQQLWTDPIYRVYIRRNGTNLTGGGYPALTYFQIQGYAWNEPVDEANPGGPAGWMSDMWIDETINFAWTPPLAGTGATTYEIYVTRTSGHFNSPTLSHFTVSQPVVGGGVAYVPVASDFKPPVAVISVGRSLVAGDANGIIYKTSTAAYTLTLVDSVFEIGHSVSVQNRATAGAITISKGSITTLSWLRGNGLAPANANRTLAISGVATITKIAANAWHIYGTGIS